MGFQDLDPDAFEKQEADKKGYRKEIQDQIDEKKRAKALARQEELAEEERLERKLIREREELIAREEQEQEKKKDKLVASQLVN